MTLRPILTGLKLGAKTVISFCKRHAPQIMVGLGIAGFAGTAFTSGRAAVRIRDILDEKDELLKTEGLTEEEAQQIEHDTKVGIAKECILPATLFLISTACTAGGTYKLCRKASVALATAYEAQKKLYAQNQAIEQNFGPEIAERIRNGEKIGSEEKLEKVKEKIEKDKKDPPKEKLPKPGWKYVYFLFDKVSCGFGGGWHDNDPARNYITIRNTFRNSLDNLMLTGHLTVNDILTKEFAYPSITEGNYGWIYDPNGFGADDMEWFVDYGEGAVSIRDFCENSGLEKYERYVDKYGMDDGIWIIFETRDDDISGYFNEINQRKLTGRGKR